MPDEGCVRLESWREKGETIHRRPGGRDLEGFIPGRWVLRGEFLKIELTAEQEAEAVKIEEVLTARGRAVNRHLARLLASQPHRELFGETEFPVRDAVHRLGAAGIDTTLAERKRPSSVRAAAKRGAKGPVSSAPAAEATPSSTDIEAAE